MVNRQFVLNGRPVGMPKESDLRMVETPVPALRDGEMLAAGAVGSVVGQIAKIKGCRAVGIVGGPEKARYVIDECGFDAALDYKATADYQAAIKELCPGGVDVYSDNVGGPIADAVLANLNMRARIGIYGQISHAHDTRPSTGPRMWRHILVARARVQGFLVFDYAARYGVRA
jgi:NADPH-dependent curcumin reductase CurA